METTKNTVTTKEGKVLKLVISQCDAHENPFKEWDGMPELWYNAGRNNETDISEGKISEFIRKMATDGKIIRYQKQICEILDLDHDWYKECQFTKDQKISELSYEIGRADFNQAIELCELFKIPYLNYTSRGYSQGDWADVLMVLTDDFFERTGCERKNSEEILNGSKETFNAWAWGDIYSFEVLELKKCECCENIDEEHVDSCGGFYGDNFETNGMKDYIPEELHKVLENYSYEDIQY
jgi:hypothetical protein